MISFDEAVRVAAAARPRRIAIDGLPVSGKTTLAEQMAVSLGAECIWLDEFVLPEAAWRGIVGPGFPFAYVDYSGFMEAVRAVSRGETARYLAYDWQTGTRSVERTVNPGRMTIVEGVSSLHPDLAPLYDLRFWVQSDPNTTLEAAIRRGVGDWTVEWRDLFLPSVQIYLQTDPARRADHRVAGRLAA